MSGSRWRSKKSLAALAFLALLLGGGGVAWLERTPILAWYCVRALASASEGDRQRRAERVADLGDAALPRVLECLAQPDDAVCANARAGLACLAARWGPGDGRSVELALRLARAFPRLSLQGQRAVLEVAGGWFSREGEAPAAGLVPNCARLLAEAGGVVAPEVQGAALELSATLVKQSQATEALSSAREIGRAGLLSPSPDNRGRAIRLALLHKGMDLLDQVVPLLNDPVVEVRRAAMLAVGPAVEVVPEDGLLPSLHDPDAEVRGLCENALRMRGLRPEHLQLGRLLTHPQAGQRLRVLDCLRVASDLDPGLWLRRLSHDSSPAVRTAALRAMSQHDQDGLDLSDRIDQMARSDPSPTVCRIAEFYLKEMRATPR